MRLTLAATALLAGMLATWGAAAQTSSGLSGQPAGQGNGQVSATGRRMPQPGATAPAGSAAGTAAPIGGMTEAQQRAATLKVQRATEARDRAWDARMKRTMTSICGGC